MSLHSRETVESDKPAKIALLSDVHGNLPAFKAVLEDVERSGADTIWCLGDLVGYGAQPDECVALARETCDVCLVGNHDLVVLGKLDIATFSANAAVAARWTQDQISNDTREFLAALESLDETGPLSIYHASPRDPVWEYVLSTLAAADCMDVMDARVGAIGHSHVALWFHRDGEGSASGEVAQGGTKLDISDGEWLINPGGVGQPRDGDPRAAWLLLDTGDWSADWRRVEYPIEEAAGAIEQAGLPQALATRLFVGQ
ncbi:MAG TPA: metallophosphoesterase family protein [Thermoleophilaceae bacterium]